LGLIEGAAGRARGATVVDLGCGWGALGLQLAQLAPRVRVGGWDLDEELLDLGRRVTTRLGLHRRVQLRAADVQDPDAWGAEHAAVVVCQALLVHVPRARAFLSGLGAALPAGARVGVVETDLVTAARAVRDSVTDPDGDYAALRIEVARALSRGGSSALGVDRRLGRNLDRRLHDAGLQHVDGIPLGAESHLPSATPAQSERARWFEARLQRRIDQGDDPVDRALAEAGGLEPARYVQWLARRSAADRQRLRALRRGRYAREDGWLARATWGVKAG